MYKIIYTRERYYQFSQCKKKGSNTRFMSYTDFGVT